MEIDRILQEEIKAGLWQVQAAVRLLDEGNTIPFIARYRKEATGGLNDEQLRLLGERLFYLRNLEERKKQVLAAIEEQGMLTGKLRKQIEEARTLVVVEDLYRPFRPKRRTRATVAREKGLEPLADLIRLQRLTKPALEEAERFVSPEKEVSTPKEALEGAMDILAEAISEKAEYRIAIRGLTARQGKLVSKAKDAQADTVFSQYYDYEEPIRRLAGHRILAVDRGEKQKILTVRITAPEDQILAYLEKKIVTEENPYTAPILRKAAEDGYRRLMGPAIERELRGSLTQDAQEKAIGVFGKNLTQLLMQPTVSGQTVLGWDPAFRTGCKLAVVDATGKVLDTAVIYPTPPQNKVSEAKALVKKLVEKYGITLISLGNGTASRESEQVIAELIRELGRPLQYVIVNEAGASVYSASKLAAEEFPLLDVGQRSAASIARRLQDPLSELVKIEPGSIGVGQYQHDVNQKKLGEALSGVVEDCVNKVGVDLNTASVPLLSYISGISRPVAKNIVAYREAHGKFPDRKTLLKVPKLGPKAYEQCAGFLRVQGGEEPLDATGVHPESYPAVKALLKQWGLDSKDIKGGGITGLKKRAGSLAKLAESLGIGEMTLADILEELEKPGRDPREEMPKPVLRKDVLEMSDLKEGMILKGTVRNVTDFGAFVDIGVHQDGLVHISKITDKKFIRHPLEAVSVGDVVEVQVLSVDLLRKRIQLSMVPN